MKKLLFFLLFLLFAAPAFAQFPDQRQYAAFTTGSANAQVAAISNYALNPGVALRFVAGFTNTGPATLNVGATGDVAVVKQTSSGLVPMVGGEIVAAQISEVVFDGAQYELLNAPATPPSGQVATFAMATCPAGWTEVNGALLSRTTYPTLFAALGTLYGSTNATNFNIPDGRGRFVRQWADAGSIDPSRFFGSNQALQVGFSTGTVTATSTTTVAAPTATSTTTVAAPTATSVSTFSGGTTTPAVLYSNGGLFTVNGGSPYAFTQAPVTGSVATTTTVTAPTAVTTTTVTAPTAVTTTTGTTSNLPGNTDNRPVNIAFQQCIKL